jgi:hypothetical protein
MFKKPTCIFLLLIFVVFAFTKCNEGCNNLPTSKIPLFRLGDTLIYAIDTVKRDTFRVTTFDIGSFDGSTGICVQRLNYEIKNINKSTIDASNLDKISAGEDAEFPRMNLHLDSIGGNESIHFDGADSDTTYKYISIGGKAYSTVYYFSLDSAKHWRNLYYNYQYGVLSVEFNKHLIWLLDIRPAR